MNIKKSRIMFVFNFTLFQIFQKTICRATPLDTNLLLIRFDKGKYLEEFGKYASECVIV